MAGSHSLYISSSERVLSNPGTASEDYWDRSKFCIVWFHESYLSLSSLLRRHIFSAVWRTMEPRVRRLTTIPSTSGVARLVRPPAGPWSFTRSSPLAKACRHIRKQSRSSCALLLLPSRPVVVACSKSAVKTANHSKFLSLTQHHKQVSQSTNKTICLTQFLLFWKWNRLQKGNQRTAQQTNHNATQSIKSILSQYQNMDLYRDEQQQKQWIWQFWKVLTETEMKFSEDLKLRTC